MSRPSPYAPKFSHVIKSVRGTRNVRLNINYEWLRRDGFQADRRGNRIHATDEG